MEVTRLRRQRLTLRAVVAAAHVAIVALATPICAAAPAEPRIPESAEELTRGLVGLSSKVRRDEAEGVAQTAFIVSRDLKRKYRAGGPALFNNLLVNAGLKKRGLCHHWTRDLGNQLASLKLRSLQLRWGIARAGTLREHNAVVVTARGQPFERGIVLDAWRQSGRLFWGSVAVDRYPWEEDPQDSFRSVRR